MGRQRASKVHTAKHSDPNEYARRQVERTLEMIRDKEGQGLMTIKERLNEYRDLEKEIRSLEEEIEEIYTRATSPSKFRLSHEPHGPNKQFDPMGELVTMMTDKALRLGDCVRKAKDERKYLESLIENLPSIQRRLIRLRYVKGKSWEEVCVELSYSWKHTHRIHSRALENMTHNDTKNSDMV